MSPQNSEVGGRRIAMSLKPACLHRPDSEILVYKQEESKWVHFKETKSQADVVGRA